MNAEAPQITQHRLGFALVGHAPGQIAGGLDRPAAEAEVLRVGGIGAIIVGTRTPIR